MSLRQTGRTLMDAEIKASAPGLGGRNWLRLGSMREAGLIAIMLALCVAMTFASPHFLTWEISGPC